MRSRPQDRDCIAVLCLEIRPRLFVEEGVPLYLLYLDESGTHGGSPAYFLGGLAIHEHDVYHLQQRLETMLQAKLPAGYAAPDFELHGAEIKSPQNLDPAVAGHSRAHSWPAWPHR